MAKSTILVFGTVHHPVLTLLYHYLLERGRRRVVYIANESFPIRPGFFYQLSQDRQNGRILLDDGGQVDWDNVVSTALDGYFVQPPGLEVYAPTDQEYLQAESWAALIALFAGLARRGPVANHILNRDVVGSRLATLSYLAGHGLEVPAVCVTSDPERARYFLAHQRQGVVYRPLTGRNLPFQDWDSGVEERLERLPLCPVHLEGKRDGVPVEVMRVGERWLTTSEVPPTEVLEKLDKAADQLGLHLAEAHLRRQGEHWTCMDLLPFLTPALFANPDTADLVARFFEEGAVP
jgi:hypothetical protein